MTTNYDKLSDFLTKNAKDATIVAPNMKLAKPLFDMVGKDGFQFGKIVDLDRVEVAQAILLATGATVSQVITVSKTNLFCKPEWMSEAVYKRSFSDSFEFDIGSSLWDSLWDSLKFNLGDNLWDNFFDNFKFNFWDNLGYSFRISLWDRLLVNLSAIQSGSLLDNLWASLFFFFGFTLLGDLKKVEQFKPMVKLCADGYLPIGFKDDESGKYLIFGD